MAKNDIVAGLDIGTTKICCVVAELGESGEVIVSGVGISPSSGMKRGVVVDIESTVRAIEETVIKASRQAGHDVDSVYVGVTGEHITSLNSRGVTAITHPDREINEADVERALEQSRVIVIPPDRAILHAIPRSYTIDGQNGIRHPVGMSGTRLEVETHIVTAAQTFLQNVEKCVTRAGLSVDDLVLEPIATAEAVVLPAEKNLGVCLVDIGGGTTDLAIFQGGEIYYSAAIPIGGERVTSDVAFGLQMAAEDAEALKIKHGCAFVDSINDEETVPVKQIGREQARQLRRRALCEMIQPRMEELFEFVQKEIAKSSCQDQLPAGIVLTGGGSQLTGAADCAAHVLGLPVRLGKPTGIAGLGDVVNNPICATAVGLAQYGIQRQVAANRPAASNSPLGGMSKLFKWLSRFRPE